MYSIPSLRALLSKTGPGPVAGNYPFYTNGAISSQAISGDNLYIAGNFTSVGKYSDLKSISLCILNSTNASANYTSVNRTLFNGSVLCSVISGNYIYVGGSFTVYNNQYCERIAKISLIDGSLDTTFATSTGFSSTVNSIALDNSGNLYAGGAFTTYKGTTRQYIAKLDATTAALDTTFDSASGFDNNVSSIALDGSGNLYVGGTLTAYKGTTRQRVAKLNATTAALDTTFDTTSGFGATVNTIQLDGSGNLYVGGQFTTYKGTTRQYIAKLNATTAALDTTFDSASGFGAAVVALALDGSGGLYVGGTFTTYKGTQAQRVCKLNATTAALNTTFDTTTTTGFNGQVSYLLLDGSGNLYCGGAFTTYQTITRQYIAKLNATTAALDTTFDSASGFSTTVNSIALDGSGNLYVSSASATYKNINNTVTRNRIAKISLLTGNIDTTFNPGTGFTSTVNVIKLDSSGNIYAGGAFTTYQGTTRQYIVKINGIDATIETGLNSTNGFNAAVNDIVLDGLGSLYAAGSFTTYKGATRQYIAKLDASSGSNDNTFDAASGFNGLVNSIALDSSGNLYVGGSFTTYKGTARQYIAKLNAATAALDTTFDAASGFNAGVNRLRLDSSGNLYVGGSFTSYKSYLCNYFCRLNPTNAAYLDLFYSSAAITGLEINDGYAYPGGTFTSLASNTRSYGSFIDNSLNISSIKTNFTGSVRCSYVEGNYIYVGGNFTAYKNQSVIRIAKISLIDGSLDTTFNPSTSFNSDVYSITGDGSGNIYAGGSFTTYQGTTRQYIAKLNATTAALDATFDSASGFNNTVYSITLDNSGNLYVGGLFTAYKTSNNGSLIKINATTAAYLDSIQVSSSGYITSLKIKDSSLYFGGEFSSLSLSNQNAIPTLNSAFVNSFGLPLNIGSSFNGQVNTSVVSGNFVYVGGSFTSYKGQACQYLAKISLIDGSLDTTFDTSTGFNNIVSSITLDGSGNLYAGGSFTTYKGTTRQYIVKLNATTAALDTTFDAASGFNNAVYSIALDGSGNIYCGGAFTTYKTVNSGSLIKINATTAAYLDSIQVSSGGYINSLKIKDSSLYFGGEFSSLSLSNQYPSLNSAFVNSSSGLPLNIGSSFNSQVYTSVVSGNFVYVGGSFTSYKGQACQFLAKISLIDGSLDTTFDTSTGFNNRVTSIKLDGSGNIYVGGYFSAYKGTTRQCIAKLNATTAALDATFDTASGPDNGVLSLEFDGSGNLYVGGEFKTYKTTNKGSLIKINATTAAYLDSIQVSSGGYINSLKIKDSSLYFGGEFTSLSLSNQYPSLNSAFVNSSSGLPLNIGSSFNGQVNTSVVSGNFVYVGGSFTSYKGQACQYLAKISLIDGSLDTTFDTSTGFNNIVNSITLDGSGNIYAAGAFSTYKGTGRGFIAKLNSTNAALDTVFDTTVSFNTSVSSITLDSLGNLYAGGSFTNYKGTTRQYIVKLNATTAALDTTFDAASGFNNAVYSIALDGSGNLYCGGAFTTYKGTTGQRIAKLNAETAALDTTFDSASGFSANVNSIALDGSGNLYVGGVFASYKGTARNGIAKINATTAALDATFDSASGFNNTVYSIVLGGSGNLYVGGQFTTYKGTSRTGLAKINTTTAALDTSFNPLILGTLVQVFSINTFSGGIYLGGSFTSVLFPCQRLNKVDLNFNYDSNFNTATAFDNAVQSIQLDDSGNLYVGGRFTTYKGTTRQRVAKLDATTAALDTTFDAASGFNDIVYSIGLDGSGNLYAGGSFTAYKGTSRTGLAKINATTAALDASFNTTITGGVPFVLTVTLYSGGIFFGGTFNAVLFPCQRLGKVDLNFNYDSNFNTATAFNSSIKSIELDDSGNLYAGGTFTTYKGTARQYIAKINAATAALDTTFDTSTGFNSAVNYIALDGSGNIYAGGPFATYKGITRQSVARLNVTTAALDANFSLATTGQVYTISIFSSGIFIGGNFTSILMGCERLSKINFNFQYDSNFNTATAFNNTVQSIQLDDSGNLYVGGSFTTYKGTARQYIAKLNAATAALDTTFDAASGFSATVNSIALDGSGNLYCGGSFTTYKGNARQRIAKLDATTAALDSAYNSRSSSTINFLNLINNSNIFVGSSGIIYGDIVDTRSVGKFSTSSLSFDSSFLIPTFTVTSIGSFAFTSTGAIFVGGSFSNALNKVGANNSVLINKNNGSALGYT